MFSSVISLTISSLHLLALVSAHPGGHDFHSHVTREEQLAAEKRELLTRNCASQIHQFNFERRMAREGKGMERSPRKVKVTSSPHYSTIQNKTCIATPEVTEGPYYVHNELIRHDLRETQGGVTLILDIGVMDITTCKPLKYAYVDLWSANATGHYSGFTTANMDASSGGGSGNNTMGGGSPGANGTSVSGSMPTGSMTGSGSTPTGTAAPPSGSGAPGNGTSGGGDGGGAGTSVMTDELKFLRGGYPTNKNGIVEFYTMFPGFYTGRTVHIHTAVITQWKANKNGTLSAAAGHVRHIGQIFFNDTLTDEVVSLYPYNTNTQTRTTNSEDSIFAQENSNGYNAFPEVKALGKNITTSGLLAYITIGVDTSRESNFTSTAYWDPNA